MQAVMRKNKPNKNPFNGADFSIFLSILIFSKNWNFAKKLINSLKPSSYYQPSQPQAMSISYKDILVNGEAITEPSNDDTKHIVQTFSTFYVRYDDSTYEQMQKCKRELERKWQAKTYLAREAEQLFCETDSKNDETIMRILESIIPTKYAKSIDFIGKQTQEYFSTYNCSKTFALEINNRTKIVKMFWDDGGEYVLFKSMLPPIIHDEVVKTFFTDVNAKFVLHNYDRIISRNPQKTNKKKEVIVDEDGFTTVTKPATSKLSKKRIDEMQLCELKDQLDIYVRMLEEKQKAKEEKARIADELAEKQENDRREKENEEQARKGNANDDSDSDDSSSSSTSSYNQNGGVASLTDSDDDDYEVI
jgi:hypothetical protein